MLHKINNFTACFCSKKLFLIKVAWAHTPTMQKPLLCFILLEKIIGGRDNDNNHGY